MKEIKCPKCGEVFSVDESDYNAIVKQVRDETFKEEVNERIKIELNNKNNEFELKKRDIEANNTKTISEYTIIPRAGANIFFSTLNILANTLENPQ